MTTCTRCGFYDAEPGTRTCRQCRMKGQPAPQVYVREPAPRPRRMSGPEKRQALELEALKRSGAIVSWWHEDVKVRVGADRCWYLPDFAVVLPDGRFWFIEVKGRTWTDDARVKFMAAAREHGWARWTLKRLIDGQWVVAYDRGPTITREAA